jgi:hypothetical protein
MGNDLMARYAAEAQAEAKAERHDEPKPVRRGDYAAQAALDYYGICDSESRNAAAVRVDRR